ncbi:MAG TPA: hypothetical protein G4O18_03120 [Dehalococcoidia bacterium]|nr:hypothetical protein [Dehalococcoidia bacterium]
MSINYFKNVLKQVKSESGQVLMLVLLLLLVSGLLLPPLLSLSMTGIQAGQMYESKAHEAYAADSGLEHALWQIKYGDLESVLTSPVYDIYDYNTTWSYDLSEQLNTRDVNVSMEHVWIPFGISVPNKMTARNIIESGRLITYGSTPNASTCQVDIIFYPESGDDLKIEIVGIWLSPGFHYVTDSSSFGVPITQPHAGGEAVIWDFNSTPFTDFPGVGAGISEQRSTITFQYTAHQPGTNPATVSWVTTSGVTGVSYTWDADSRVYHITSVADGTMVESYNIKSEIRKLGSAFSGDYRAIGNSLMLDLNWDWGGPQRDTLLAESSATISNIPANAQVAAAYLYWSGWYEGGDEDVASGQILWEEDCSNMSDWNGAGPDWSVDSGEFRGHHNGGESDRYLTKKTSLDLSAYAGDEVTLSWEQDESGWLESDDRLYFSLSSDGGNTWSSNIEVFRDDNPPASFSYTIPAMYLTADFKLRFYLYGFADIGEYCSLDNMTIFATSNAFLDPCNNLNNWDAGADWSVSSGEFEGHHVGSESDRYLTMQSSLDLSGYSSGELAVGWEQRENGSLESDDRLYFAFSADGGSTWSSSYQAFRDDNPPADFSEVIPDEYLTADFKIRFYLYGFAGSGEYCYLDDIAVYERALPAADTTAIFKIDGVQVYLDGATPMQGAGELVADSSQVIDNMHYGNPHGYSYASFKDVTELVREYSAEGDGGKHPGNGTYTVGGVDADIEDEWAYAGWSLVIIYTSPETQGHQLYLYDNFLYCNHDENLDFDGDGEEGGLLSGFLVPAPITGEVNAATMSCFVTEGDDYYDGDYIALNGQKLWDGTEAESLEDVWNGQSLGMTADGVDVDTFYITWASGLLATGDTSAQIDIQTDMDIWNLVYIILSFRSEITTSDAISYSIGYVSGS